MKVVKGLFTFDGPMYKDINGVYCNMTITTEMLTRYLSVVDELTVVIRTFNMNKTYKELSYQKVEHPRIKFIEIDNLNSIKGFFKKKRTKKIIEKEIIANDLIFVRIPSIISDITTKLCRKHKKKYFAEVGGCSFDSHWNYSMIGKIIAPYMYYNQRLSVKNASYASYVTEKWLQNKYPTKGESISASNVYLIKTQNDYMFSKYKNLNKNSQIILGTAAGIDVKYKGQKYIVKQVKKLRKQGYNVKYELIGAGKGTKIIKEAKRLKVLNYIEIKGVLLKDQVFKWLDNIDIYIQPSKQEGLPRSVIEAMSRGCLVVGSNIAGIPELISKKAVFKNFKTKTINKTIRYYLDDKELLINESIRNFEYSKNFERDILDKKRDVIFESYKNEIMNDKEITT